MLMIRNEYEIILKNILKTCKKGLLMEIDFLTAIKRRKDFNRRHQ
jgi:hypothetical protein